MPPTALRFTIDLDRSRLPGAFRDDQNLWRAELRRMYRLIRHHLAGLDARQTDEEALPKLSIAIFGPSGSGKSSLLRTLRDDVRRGDGSLVGQEGLAGKVYCLPAMDPTTWAESDQFLYAFLAAALEEEQVANERSAQSYQQGLSPVQLAFQEVNEYLRVLDDPATPDEHDPLGLSLQKLERHTSGLKLRDALSRFIEKLRRQLGCELLLLPVDDLDMAPHHLVRSLNAFGSFLVHSRLVPIFTFTDRMPEELIEAHYDQRLAAQGASGRAPGQVQGSEQRLSISQQLAVQFLTRCFPVRNRIRLGASPARVQRAAWQRRLGLPTQPGEQAASFTVLELLNIASFLLFGHHDQEDAHTVRAALRPTTLRRQLQVFDAMADCHLEAFRVPQITSLAAGEEVSASAAAKEKRLHELWRPAALLREAALPVDREYRAAREVAAGLQQLKIGASWASIYNGATWSLLNVHRDTLRELGLYLEDLYSWSPTELRSYVLETILSKDRVTRRTVVDRWFNRADFRRSQVLSLLAANIFRPWMEGEEPYGDDERALRHQLAEERRGGEGGGEHPLDALEAGSSESLRRRLTIPAVDGLSWFLNVTLGFYLPLTLARNWVAALSADEPVRGRMTGSGWDLGNAPISAIRIADAKGEIFSFGMHFLHPVGYRRALEETSSVEKHRDYLLLRIWSCCGFSNGRYWAAISLWRGLSLIGQAIELASKHGEVLRSNKGSTMRMVAESSGEDSSRLQGAKQSLQPPHLDPLFQELLRLIRGHCLSGLVPGSLLREGAREEDLLQGFPPWDSAALADETAQLAFALLSWLVTCWDDLILPYPVGDVWIGWRDCFVRRIHGEYILGAFWPRLHSAFLERQDLTDAKDKRDRAKTRSAPNSVSTDSGGEEFLWTAYSAMNVWSEMLLEYWRGCPPILRLLLLCPVFLKAAEGGGSGRLKPLTKDWFERIGLPEDLRQEFQSEAGQQKLKHERVGDVFLIERAPIDLFNPPAVR